MSSRKISFAGANGAELAARLDLPLGEARAYAIFAHCFTCSKDTRAATYLSGALAEQGIATLRFDFTGLGGSGGDFANTNFSSNVGDLVAAADYLRANHGAPEILIGHSLGGAAVLAAAPKIADARAVATINAPFDPAHVLQMMAAARPEIDSAGEAEVTLGGRPFRIRKQFIEDIGQHRVAEGLGRMKKALLVMHAPLDASVDIGNASQIFLAAKHPKSFVSLDGADHLLSRRDDAMYAGSVLAAWAARY
ncbi:MAG: alpha/beta fold hydrolase, partial [Burkholderiales bacterium]